jgi:hypothetical protein
LGAGGDAESAARAGVPNTDLAIGLGCQAADAATAMATAAPTTTAGRPFIMRENIDLTASGSSGLQRNAHHATSPSTVINHRTSMNDQR